MCRASENFINLIVLSHAPKRDTRHAAPQCQCQCQRGKTLHSPDFPNFLLFVFVSLVFCIFIHIFFCGIFRIDFPGRIMNFSRVSLAFLCRQLAPYPFPASGNRTHICQAHSNWTRGRPNAVPEYILIYQLFLHSKHESIALPLSLATLPESSESSALSRTTRNDLTPLTPPTLASRGPSNETCEGLLKNCL